MRLFAIRIPDDLVPDETFDKLATLIEQPGRDRLRRYRLPEDSLRALVARLTVTWYLYINKLLQPGELPTFGRKGKGKPTLTTPHLSPPLEFNNTHESSYILFTTLSSPSPLSSVGIDIMLQPRPSEVYDIQEGITDQLTLLERRSLAVPMRGEGRARRISLMWALKEGFTKAVGEGITFGMERIEVHLNEERKAENGVPQVGVKGGGEDQEQEIKVDKVLIDGKDANQIGWEWKIGEIDNVRKGEKERYSWAVWWRGEVVELSQRSLELEHVPWDNFVAPLLELAEDMQKRNK
ncbi:hypothetical protein CI109_104813 [Kwoniella shandongensis]|uniref:Uncharacterized protein n=1 Tax=Kwoniella shandongensis TaxID=1734106 RepID=A0A5M6BRJ0_9TREE|nr:uncharacterized protein CI109_006205 [Kwoniella shandongensis]KAA5525514.1 hypothetical protein CI109_006205 [Kwoniella shandongensis]